MNKYVIIILVSVIIIAIVGVFAFTMNTHENVKLSILGSEIEEGGNIHIKLTNLNETPLKGKHVNVSVIDKNGKIVSNKSVKIDSNGKGSFSLKGLSKGKYTVNATFDGDDKYSANNTSNNIKITKKKAVKSTPQVTETSETPQTSTEPTENSNSNNDKNPTYEEYTDANGDTVHKFNWGGGMTEYDYDDGRYIYEYDDGRIESGYFPGHGPQ